MWIAASLGPYGAALHNGAEYHGRYAIGFDDLVAFHAERLDVLAESGADLLALETIPSLEEARALLRALGLFPALTAWISFTCRDAAYVAHGEPLRECAEAMAESEQIVAIGINCTAPRYVEALLGEARRGCGDSKAGDCLSQLRRDVGRGDAHLAWDFRHAGVWRAGSGVVCRRSAGHRRLLPHRPGAYCGGGGGFSGFLPVVS